MKKLTVKVFWIFVGAIVPIMLKYLFGGLMQLTPNQWYIIFYMLYLAFGVIALAIYGYRDIRRSIDNSKRDILQCFTDYKQENITAHEELRQELIDHRDKENDLRRGTQADYQKFVDDTNNRFEPLEKRYANTTSN